jgi:hypothetical protein
LVQFEDDISSDITRPKCRGMVTALDVSEPGGNVGVGPGPQEITIIHGSGEVEYVAGMSARGRGTG